MKKFIKLLNYPDCAEFINKLPNKYETIIGENGDKTYRVEKSKEYAIARAMMKKSSIILLDEATSSSRFSETESKIQEALKILTNR